MVVLLI